MAGMAESTVESAALAWLESLGWQVKYGPEIALGTLAAEHGVFDMASFYQREAWLASRTQGLLGHIKAGAPRAFPAGLRLLLPL